MRTDLTLFQAEYGSRSAPPYRTPRPRGSRGSSEPGPSRRRYSRELAALPADEGALASAIEGFVAAKLVDAERITLRQHPEPSIVGRIKEIWGSRALWVLMVRAEWTTARELIRGGPSGLLERCPAQLIEELEKCVAEVEALMRLDPDWVQPYAERLIPRLAAEVEAHLAAEPPGMAGELLDYLQMAEPQSLAGQRLADACLQMAEPVVRDLLTEHMPAQFERGRFPAVPEGPPEWRFLAYLHRGALDRFRKSRAAPEPADPVRLKIAEIQEACRERVLELCGRQVDLRSAVLERAVGSGAIPAPQSASESWGRSQATLATLAIVLDHFAVSLPPVPGDPVQRRNGQRLLRLHGALTQRDLAPWLGTSPETVNKKLGWSRNLQAAVEGFLGDDSEWLAMEKQFALDVERLEALLAQARKKIEELESSRKGGQS